MTGSDHAVADLGTRKQRSLVRESGEPRAVITTAPEGLAALLSHVDLVT
ncbi:hypothetical protein [Streptomyces sp. NPDC060065]